MKRLFLLFVLCCFVYFGNAQSKGECFGYLKKYDVPKGYLELMKDDRAGFWTKRKDYDRRTNKNMIGLESKGKAATKAHETIIVQNVELDNALKGITTINDSYKGILDSLYHVFELNKIDFSIKFYVVPEYDFNAAAAPNGAIVINKGLIENLSFDELVGVVAHELNHYVNKHSQLQLYAVAKKEQSNRFWAGLGAAMSGVAAGVNAYYGGMAGQSQETIDKTTQNFTKLIGDIYDTSANATLNFKFRYSREEEIESDIAAYRFLQLIGINPSKYIDVMNIISQIEGGNTTTDKHDEHPAGVVRKKILQSIAEYDKENSNGKQLNKLNRKKKEYLITNDDNDGVYI